MPIMQKSIQYPHCDSRVLHKPGECEFCDLHPEWQKMREDQRINFTGHYDAGKMKCPAEQARGLEIIYAWVNNRKKPNVREGIKEIVSRLLFGTSDGFLNTVADNILEKFEVFPKEGFGA